MERDRRANDKTLMQRWIAFLLRILDPSNSAYNTVKSKTEIIKVFLFILILHINGKEQKRKEKKKSILFKIKKSQIDNTHCHRLTTFKKHVKIPNPKTSEQKKNIIIIFNISSKIAVLLRD